MRKVYSFALVIILFAILIGARAPYAPAKSSSLEIKGYVFKGDEKVSDALVSLYQNNQVVQKEIIKKSKFQFILFSDMRYMVEISKEGCVTERIQISTKEKTEYSGKYLYEFKVDLMDLKKFKGIDISDLDFPTALIKYDPKEGEYLHDLSYSQQVKDELKKLKAEARKK
ncbi:MAG: hypothetical protein P1U41_00280 [Vicingaceae bacterium]|nr:hypothetical protein [Vicingaceae bacterium]